VIALVLDVALTETSHTSTQRSDRCDYRGFAPGIVKQSSDLRGRRRADYSAAAGRAGTGTVFGPKRSRYGVVSISSNSISRDSTLRFHSWCAGSLP
jgi:hypothetical protein